MVPQQSLETQSNMQQTELIIKQEEMAEEMTEELSTVFGSQMVAKDSHTPYSDATQVSILNSLSVLFLGYCC